MGGVGQPWGNPSQSEKDADSGPWSEVSSVCHSLWCLSGPLLSSSVSVWVSSSFLPISYFSVCTGMCVPLFLESPSAHLPIVSPVSRLSLCCCCLLPSTLLPTPSFPSSIPSLSLIFPALPSSPGTCAPVPCCTPLFSLSTSSLPQASIEKEGVNLVAILCTHKHW